MAVYVELTTDAFEDNFRAQAKARATSRSKRAGRRVARRPHRGIEIKEDTYAMIKIVQANGTEIPLVDSSSPDGLTTSGYANFILQSVQEARMEKHQLVETFGDSYIFFFGESPRFIDVQALLVNSHDFNWRAEWWENYNKYMRGTKLAELGARLYLFYDDIVIEGYMMNSQASEQSMQPYTVTLAFRLFVTNYSNISFVGSEHFPVRSSVSLPDGVELTATGSATDIISAYRGEAMDRAEIETWGNEIQQLENSGATTTEESPHGVYQYPEHKAETSQNPLASGSRISKILQAVPSSFGVAQDFWSFLERSSDSFELLNLVHRNGRPLRGKIAENVDEYSGYRDTNSNFGYAIDDYPRPPAGAKGTVRTQVESDDLWRETIQFLSCYGADANSSDAMHRLGLAPAFSAHLNVSASLRLSGGGVASAHGAATFSATGLTAPFQDLKNGVNFLGDRIESDLDKLSGLAQGDLSAFAKDPLLNVFGGAHAGGHEFGADRPKYTEGAGDPLYGYPSDFADGHPGYGGAGFGDLGGKGHGSALGHTGDPGFKDPDKFTFAGVSDNRGAFDRLNRPKHDSTAITANAHAGASLSLSAAVGASVSIEGKISAFALVSLSGDLDVTGRARLSPEAIAERQAQEKFGFSVADPFGVNCPEPSGTLSTGTSHHWP